MRAFNSLAFNLHRFNKYQMKISILVIFVFVTIPAFAQIDSNTLVVHKDPRVELLM